MAKQVDARDLNPIERQGGKPLGGWSQTRGNLGTDAPWQSRAKPDDCWSDGKCRDLTAPA